MKLLALAAALLCALALSAPVAAAAPPRPVDFELAPPASAEAAAAGNGGRAVVSRALRTPRRFNLVGLRWRGAAEPDVKLRVRKRGRWSRWAGVAAHSEHNPDLWRGERLAEASDPIWVGRDVTSQSATIPAARPRASAPSTTAST